MNNELKQKFEVVILPILLLEKLPITDYGIAFVSWAVYNRIGPIDFDETEIRTIAEQFIQEHRFCIKIVDQIIISAQVGDSKSFAIFANELMGHPECMKILDDMFLRGEL